MLSQWSCLHTSFVQFLFFQTDLNLAWVHSPNAKFMKCTFMYFLKETQPIPKCAFNNEYYKCTKHTKQEPKFIHWINMQRRRLGESVMVLN